LRAEVVTKHPYYGPPANGMIPVPALFLIDDVAITGPQKLNLIITKNAFSLSHSLKL
jgi:hypothetical protein